MHLTCIGRGWRRWAFDGRKNLYAPNTLMGAGGDPVARVFHVKVMSDDGDRPRPYQASCPTACTIHFPPRASAG